MGEEFNYMNNLNTKKCQICNGEVFQPIGRPRISLKIRSFIKHDYQVLQCKQCSLYFVSPPIAFSEDTWQKLYEDEYFSEMTKWWERKRQKDRKERLDKLEKFNKGRIKTFLDIGSGEGYILIESLLRNWETHGIDIADNRIDRARADKISFFMGNIFNAKYPDSYFDCVYMDSVLEHVQEPLTYLNEINRIMKKNGSLYIGVPNENSLFNDTKSLCYSFLNKNKISVRIDPFVPPYHINGFTRKTLTVAAKKSSFNILQLRNFAGHYDLLKYKPFSRPFFIHTALLPIHIVAILLRKQTYLEAFFQKI